MRKVSHKFSYQALEVIQQLASRTAQLKGSVSDHDRLLFCVLLKLQIRLSRLLMFSFPDKKIPFTFEEFIALRLNYGRTHLLWGTYEDVIINEFLSEGGKKL